MKKACVMVAIWVGLHTCTFAQPAAPKARLKAEPLPLSSIRLTGGPLKRAQDLDAQYLLDLQPDRMLAFLRESAGLKRTAEGYGGWDGPGRQLTGHIAGHYLSAVSLMYAATGDQRFKSRADEVVSELQNIQNAQGDGYIGALKDGEGVNGKTRFEDLSKGVIRSGGFDLNGLWSPWYVEHKVFAGLRDAYRLAGNRNALEVEIKFAGWVEKILAPLNDDQVQRMLATEFGGMNEVLADLYADTGNARWLKLSDKFEHRSVVVPLANGKDILAGKHANTQVPKMIGELERYIYTGDETDGKAAKFFWDEVAEHHSFATGGHGKNEYFGPPDKLNDMVDGRTAESCGTYNMIKMARMLFSIEPESRYADFTERATLNAILGGQDPEDGRVSYMVPVGRSVQHEYQSKFDDFTCCVGSQMETHAFHAYGIYYQSLNKLWVGMYAPTTVDWTAEGVKLEMTTDLPIGNAAALKIVSGKPRDFTLALRRPYWAAAGFAVKVNGKAVANLPKPGSYVEITRVWRPGDSVELLLPKAIRTEPLPDNPNRMAIMWGPLVLAGDLGQEINLDAMREAGTFTPPPPAPVIVTDRSVNGWLKPVDGKPGTYRVVNARLESTASNGAPSDVQFRPFYEMARRRYAIYWDVYTPTDWKKKSESYAAEELRKRKLEMATVAFAQPGMMQSERDYNQQGEGTAPVQLMGRYGRQGAKWFSFDLPVDLSHPTLLIVTYSNDARAHGGAFEVFANGTKIGEQTIERRSPEIDLRFFDVEYKLPNELLLGKEKVTIRFQAKDGASIPGVFGIRTVRSDMAP